MSDIEELRRISRMREELAKLEANQSSRVVTYVDTDGCEVTVLPQGRAQHVGVDG